MRAPPIMDDYPSTNSNDSAVTILGRGVVGLGLKMFITADPEKAP
jgi:hypothetical protein